MQRVKSPLDLKRLKIDVNSGVNSAPFAYGFYEKLGFEIAGEENVKHGIRSKPMQIKR